MENENITMAELDAMGVEFITLDEKIKALEAEAKLLSEEKRKIGDKLMFVFKGSDKTNYQVGGKKLIMSQRASVQTPKTFEEKKAYAKFLREKYGDELFWTQFGVHSQTLNAFYKAERDAAIDQGNIDFKIPGIGDETISYQLSVRK